MNPARWAERVALGAALGVLRRLGPARSSDLCGGVARAIGPLLPVSNVAHRNLQLAMPELDAAARRRIVRGVWENLGRVAGELPHLATFAETAAGPGWEIAGGAHLDAVRGGRAILATGHFSNWELMLVATTSRIDRVAAVYRASDDPAIDALVTRLRQEAIGVDRPFFPKGAQGARQTLAFLRQGGSVGLLQDQKMNDGIEARFFGHKVMTASAMAALALRFECPVVPCRVERVGRLRYRVTYELPLPRPRFGDRAADILALTQAMNDRLEAWARASPESWLWLHRRWPKPCYADLR